MIRYFEEGFVSGAKLVEVQIVLLNRETRDRPVGWDKEGIKSIGGPI